MQAIQQNVKFSVMLLYYLDMIEHVAHELDCAHRPFLTDVMCTYYQDGGVIGFDTLNAIDEMQAALTDLRKTENRHTKATILDMDSRFVAIDGLSYAMSQNPLPGFTNSITGSLASANPDRVIEFGLFYHERVRMLGQRLIEDKDVIYEDALTRVEKLEDRNLLPRNAKRIFVRSATFVDAYTPLGTLEAGANQIFADCGEYADIRISNIYDNHDNLDVRGQLGAFFSQISFHERIHAIDYAPESRYGLYRGITSTKPGKIHAWVEEAVTTLLAAEAINSVEKRGIQQSLPTSHVAATNLLRILMQASDNKISLQLCGEAMFAARSDSAPARVELEKSIVKTLDAIFPEYSLEYVRGGDISLPSNAYEHTNNIVAAQRSSADVDRELGRFAAEANVRLHSQGQVN